MEKSLTRITRDRWQRIKFGRLGRQFWLEFDGHRAAGQLTESAAYSPVERVIVGRSRFSAAERASFNGCIVELTINGLAYDFDSWSVLDALSIGKSEEVQSVT